MAAVSIKLQLPVLRRTLRAACPEIADGFRRLSGTEPACARALEVGLGLVDGSSEMNRIIFHHRTEAPVAERGRYEVTPSETRCTRELSFITSKAHWYNS